ncbi:MAG TPA: ABC transporter permease [Verrucomicrobiae bacterium]|nr:ABC transporter permease [Verrucomicrobiae bacterium]
MKRIHFLNLLLAEMRESFAMAASSLAAHKLRSALTLLGVMVGVFSIIVVMTTMRAMQHYVEANMQQLGSETFVVQKWPGFSVRNNAKYWRRKDITFRQAMDVQKRVSLPRYMGIEAAFDFDEIISDNGRAAPNANLVGENVGSFAVQNWILDDGRILQESDLDGLRDVCILGSKMAKDLFPFGSPIDQVIKIDSIKYNVVGVLEPRGTMEGGNQDNFVAVPLTTGLSRYGSQWYSLSILVQSPDHAHYDETVDQVRAALRVVRKVPPGDEDDFEINSNDSVMEQVNTFTFAVRMGVAAISSIALIAAGIGIMNIMLVSVTERTREIGIRRAIGAKKRNIMTQFIMEAVVLCEIGGVIGVVFGVVGGDIGAHFMNLSPVIPVDWVILGLLICSAVGIVFGTYPAYKAANLDPIDSLRYE